MILSGAREGVGGHDSLANKGEFNRKSRGERPLAERESNPLVQALVFDFDGTLVDTETPEFTVWSHIFDQHKVRMPDGYWASMIGRGAEQEFERPAALLERLCGVPFRDSEYRHQKIMTLIDRESLRPGTEALIMEAHAKGLPCGVASSSPHLWVDRELDKRGVLHLFDFVSCADDVKRAKPFPDLYLLACDRLDAEPAQTVAIEDTPNGLAAAKAAGLFAVATPNPVTQSLDLSAADLRVDDLSAWSLADLDQALVQRRERARLSR